MNIIGIVIGFLLLLSPYYAVISTVYLVGAYLSVLKALCLHSAEQVPDETTYHESEYDMIFRNEFFPFRPYGSAPYGRIFYSICIQQNWLKQFCHIERNTFYSIFHHIVACMDNDW